MLLAIAPIALLGIAAVVAALALTMSGGAKDCPTVEWSSANVQTQANAIVAWSAKWAPQKSALAVDAMIDFMQRVFPGCKWTATSQTTIKRIDGSTIAWQAIVSRLQGKTVAQMDSALKDLVPNPVDAGG